MVAAIKDGMSIRDAAEELGMHRSKVERLARRVLQRDTARDSERDRLSRPLGRIGRITGWSSADLFGLHTPPAKPHPSYSRLSRYDCTGLCWLLEGRPVVALTADTASIRYPTGNILTFRKNSRPALGPLGDSLGDLQ